MDVVHLLLIHGDTNLREKKTFALLTDVARKSSRALNKHDQLVIFLSDVFVPLALKTHVLSDSQTLK